MLLTIILPIVVLSLSFILKLTVDRSTELPNLMAGVFELPVDIMFLAISLMVGIAIRSTTNDEIVYLLVLICIAVLVVLCWRKSSKRYETSKLYSAGFIGVFNYAISSGCLFVTIGIL